MISGGCNEISDIDEGMVDIVADLEWHRDTWTFQHQAMDVRPCVCMVGSEIEGFEPNHRHKGLGAC